MENEMGPFLIVGMLVLALVIRLIAGAMDGDRIAHYLQEKGATMTSKHWSPFGKGWFGSEKERIYSISYVDRDGHEHEAICKTSLFAGVYLTDDHIVRQARPKAEGVPPVRRPLFPASDAGDGAPTPETDRDTAIRIARLESENRQLREEIERLRSGHRVDETSIG
ncbi:MAG: hypothetical protein KDN20_03200 [Verrucomicrobiae bacterium]|nr:hypothetical protein [Verrucomicrobiae bacterium]